jgi:hypothetical protein
MESFSDLFKMDKCTPLIAYGIIVVITGICIYNVRSDLNKLGDNNKVKNLNDMFMWYEIALLLVTGVIMYGLCQYNESTLAWIVLFPLVASYVFKTVIVFLSVSNVQKIVPVVNNADIPFNNHPFDANGSQAALANSIRKQTEIQKPSSPVMASQGLSRNEQSGMVPPLNSKMSSIGGLSNIGSNEWLM